MNKHYWTTRNRQLNFTKKRVRSRNYYQLILTFLIVRSPHKIYSFFFQICTQDCENAFFSFSPMYLIAALLALLGCSQAVLYQVPLTKVEPQMVKMLREGTWGAYVQRLRRNRPLTAKNGHVLNIYTHKARTFPATSLRTYVLEPKASSNLSNISEDLKHECSNISKTMNSLIRLREHLARNLRMMW